MIDRRTVLALITLACLQIGLVSRPVQAAYCGAHCVARVLRQLGSPSPELAKIIEELNGRAHDSLPDFTLLAKSLRTRNTTALFVSRDILPHLRLRLPVILHVNNNHFVVLEDLVQDQATIWWGPGDVRVLSWKRLMETTSPVVLLVSKSASEQVQSEVAFAIRSKELGGVLNWTGIVLLGAVVVLGIRNMAASYCKSHCELN